MREAESRIGRLLTRIDGALAAVVNTVVGTLVVLMMLLVFVQVLFRYLFKATMYGAEELPTYFMIACVFLAAGIVPRKEGHIDIDIVPLFVKSKRGLLAVRAFINLLVVLTVATFTRYSIRNTAFSLRTGDVSPGLQFPIWCVTVVLPISGALMTLYYLVSLAKKLKELIRWK